METLSSNLSCLLYALSTSLSLFFCFAARYTTWTPAIWQRSLDMLCLNVSLNRVSDPGILLSHLKCHLTIHVLFLIRIYRTFLSARWGTLLAPWIARTTAATKGGTVSSKWLWSKGTSIAIFGNKRRHANAALVGMVDKPLQDATEVRYLIYLMSRVVCRGKGRRIVTPIGWEGSGIIPLFENCGAEA